MSEPETHLAALREGADLRCLGVVSELPFGRLTRQIRAPRIHEGATEVQPLIIARELLHDTGALA